MLTYTRKLFFVLIDAVLFVISIYMTLFIRFDGNIGEQHLNIFLDWFIPLTVTSIIICSLFGLYKSIWQYASVRELMTIIAATFTCTLAMYAYGLAFKIFLPGSFYVIFFLLVIVLLGGSRLSVRLFKGLRWHAAGSKEFRKRVMIVGAGEAGSMLIKELKSHKELNLEPVVFIDDDRWKQNLEISGIPVMGDRTKIPKMADKYKIDEIIVAIPSADKNNLADILRICKETRCKLKTLPGVYEIINGRVSINHIRDVSIEDLLGRDETKLSTEEIAGYLKNEVILVTGGGGSIGSELCRQIAAFEPNKLLIFDIYENNAYDLQNELLFKYGEKIDLEVLIGSIRDKERLRQVFKKYNPSVVFHAAAHKHVPLMEVNPAEAVKNNVLGTLNVAQCADEFNVKRFVLVSTDKAVNPTNIMGATKRMAEMIVQSLNQISNTDFVAVRFGNVLGSNGSVIPLFKKQIAQGGPVTITHPDIIRYFMTIPEAAQLVIQAGAMAKGGEIFILDMGKPVKIVDLAKDLIRLSGFEPDKDIKIEYTGLRPGEKLYEELLMAEEGLKKTENEKIYIGRPLGLSYDEVLLRVKALEKCLGDPMALRECMSRVVPTYSYTYDKMPRAESN